MRSIAVVSFILALVTSDFAQAQEQSLPVEVVRSVGHLGEITALAFSPDGRTLATGSGDYSVKLWDVATGLLLRTIARHSYDVLGVGFSADSKEVISVSDFLGGITILVSDTETGGLKRKLTNPVLEDGSLPSFSKETGIAVSPNGNLIALALRRSPSSARAIEMIDAHSGASVLSIPIADDSRIVFSPDGRYLAATSEDCAIIVLDVTTGQRANQLGCGSLFNLFGGPYKFDDIAFSGDGRTIAGFFDKTLTQYDVASGNVISDVDTGKYIYDLALSFDGSVVATTTSQKLDLFDRTGAHVRELEGHNQYGGDSMLIFSPDGTLLASGGEDKSVRLWDAVDWTSARPLPGVDYEIGGVAISPDGSRIASDGSGATIVWDAVAGKLARKMQEEEDSPYGCACSIGFSSDGKWLAAASRDATALTWDVESGEIVSALTYGVTDSVSPRRSVAFLPDSSIYLLGSAPIGRDPRKESEPVLWDVAARRLVFQLTSGAPAEEDARFDYPIAVSPDGSLVAGSSGYKAVNLFDPRTGELVRSITVNGYGSEALAFSPDNKLIVTANSDHPDERIEMWDVANGSLVRTITVPGDGIAALAVSPDGRVVASGGDDQTITLWSLADGVRLGDVAAHDSTVSSLAFAPNGTLVSGSKDGSVKIWNPANLELLATLVWTRTNEWIVFTPEGFFDGEGRANKLSIVRGREAYPVDAAYDLLHRPDLVREKLAGDPQGLVKSAADALDLWSAVSPR